MDEQKTNVATTTCRAGGDVRNIDVPQQITGPEFKFLLGPTCDKCGADGLALSWSGSMTVTAAPEQPQSKAVN